MLKRVVITGGTSGFGLEVARQAAAEGAELVLIGRDAAKASAVAAELGATGIGADLSDPQQLAQVMDQIGEFDHLVSTLGGAMGGGFLDADYDTIRETIEGKFFVNLRLVRAARPYLRAGGSVVLTAGAGGEPHTASGAIVGNQALVTLVQGLAVELAPSLRANAVAPSWTPTPLWRDVPEADVAATRENMAELFPLGRTASIEEVASAYLFLMRNEFVTGQTLYVDGGASLV